MNFKQMKKQIGILFLVILISINYSGSTQEVFELNIGTTNEDHIGGIIEKNNGNFIFVGSKVNNYYNPSNVYGYIAEISKQGKIINEKTVQIPDSLLYFGDIYLNSDDSYSVFGALGSKKNGYTNIFAFLKFDSEFNLLKKYYYKIPENRKSPGGSVIKNKNGNFVIHGSVTSLTSSIALYPYIIEISENGEFIREKYHITVDSPSGDRIFGLIEKQNNSGYFALTQFYPDTNPELPPGRVMNLDENFELLSYICIPEYIHNVGTLKWFTDTTYILSGKKTQYSSYKAQDDDIGLIVLDTLGNEINLKYIGKPDTTDFPGFYSNFDFSSDHSSIFVAGTQDLIFHSFPNSISKIALTKVDKDLNIIWEKFYGSDAYYIVHHIKSTKDGGCIIVSSRYDYTTQNEENDIHILKVDSEGNNIATPVNDELKIEMNEVIVFPNPVSYEINVRTAIQQTGGTFYLYDISGKQVIQTNINNINTTINISRLPSGIYLYKYHNNSKIVGNGKLIIK